MIKAIMFNQRYMIKETFYFDSIDQLTEWIIKEENYYYRLLYKEVI